MHLSQSFFTKHKKTQSIKSEMKGKQYCIFHDLIISPFLYEGRDSFLTQSQNENQRCANFRSSFYICKRIQPTLTLEQLPTLIIKRVAYRKENKVDQWERIVYNDTQCKNIDQISTEFHCYELLKGSHRAVQLIQFLHQNTRSSEDKRLFYNFFKLNDRRSKGIQNAMFVLEEMNQGSLKEQIDRISEKKQQKFKEEEIIQYTCQIAEGLLQLKKRGIIHRDLRPTNILIHNKQIKFSDFDSAFIKGYSSYKNIKNGVNMQDTTPLQIMLLISESEQKLKKFTSQELYQLQKNADIYFLGINIYTMVFSHNFESFNGGKVLKNMINMKKRNGFCPKLLDLMEKCLEKDSHVRIDLDNVIKILIEIEKEAYFNSSTYTRVYLAPEPLNLQTFSSNQMQQRLKSETIESFYEENIDTYQMKKLFNEKVRIGMVQRHTERFEIFAKNMIEQKQDENIWKQFQLNSKRNQQSKLRQLIQKHLQSLQIKVFYYQFVFRILCQVNLDNLIVLTPDPYLQNIQTHLDLLSGELTVILTFLYDNIIRCSFTQDPNYIPHNIGYENKRVFDSIRLLHSRKSFFQGRKKSAVNMFNVEDLRMRMQEYKLEHQGKDHSGEIQQIQKGVRFVVNSMEKINILESLVKEFYQKEYISSHERKSFQFQCNIFQKVLQKIEKLGKEEMIQTIINLIIAYQKLKLEKTNNFSNLKNAIFMLMILQSQDTSKIHKNDMVIIKTELTNMINLGLGWKPQELEAFFTNYTEIHQRQVNQGLHEIQSHAFLFGSSKDNFQQNYQIKVIQIPKKEDKVDKDKEDQKKVKVQLEEAGSNFSFFLQQKSENIVSEVEAPNIGIKQCLQQKKIQEQTFLFQRSSIKVQMISSIS